MFAYMRAYLMDEGCPICDEEERNRGPWLKRQLELAEREVRRWPKWMRDELDAWSRR